MMQANDDSSLRSAPRQSYATAGPERQWPCGPCVLLPSIQLQSHLMELPMKRLHLYLALCAVPVLFAAGCNKADDPPKPNLSEKASPAPGSSASPTVTPPVMPDANVPKGAEAAAPVPGQAGDQSSPAFKAGGKTDPHK
jgi:hypothetical protein